jgi:hypothetical protein
VSVAEERLQEVLAGLPDREEMEALIERERIVWGRLERAYQEATGRPRRYGVTKLGELTRWWASQPRRRRLWLAARWAYWDYRRRS